MPLRRRLSIALVFTVFLLSVFLVPVGHGPFAAAFGPIAKFQALRALFLLMWLIAAAIRMRSEFDVACSAYFDGLASHENLAWIASGPLSGGSQLRC